jgi:hypothetical protein
MFLLLIDMLGVKARWALGSAEATAALAAFDGFVLAGLDQAGVVPASGGIDSDAAALVFETIDDALAAAREIFMQAFRSGDPFTDERYWLRGVCQELCVSGVI